MSTSASGLPDAGGGVYGILISLGFGLAQALVSHLKKSKLPQEIIDAAQNVVNMIEAHANDTMTKDEWEALRG